MRDVVNWSELLVPSKEVECKIKELSEKYRHLFECIPDIYKENDCLVFNFCGECFSFPLSDFKNDCFEILPAENNYLKAIAGETLATGLLVYIDDNKVYSFDSTNITLLNRAVGFTAYNAIENEMVEIITSGNICQELGGLIPDTKYFAGPNGTITHIPPVDKIRQIVAVSLSPTKILVNIQDGIIKVL